MEFWMLRISAPQAVTTSLGTEWVAEGDHLVDRAGNKREIVHPIDVEGRTKDYEPNGECGDWQKWRRQKGRAWMGWWTFAWRRMLRRNAPDRG